MKNNLHLEHKLNKHSSIPLHQQLGWIIEQKINQGYFQKNEKLPSENELMESFCVSRQVIRQCLNNLRHQGLIYTKHGLGSFVSAKKIDKSLAILQSYHDSMAERDLEINVQIINKVVIPTPDILTEKLNTHQPEVFFLERLSFIDNSPISIVISYLALPSEDLRILMNFKEGSLYEYLLQTFGITFDYSTNTIQTIFAKEYESQMLDVAVGTPLLEISGESYFKEQPLEYSRVIYPAASIRLHYNSFMKRKAQQVNITLESPDNR